jgi:hypothetical protein
LGKIIRITCQTTDNLSFEELTEFQGELKDRTEKQIDHLIESIDELGFTTPIFVWVNNGVNYILDGHGRKLALTKMKSMGYEIPPIPVVLIEADTEESAKKKLVEVNNVSGTFTKNGFIDIVKDLDIEVVNYNIPDLDLEAIDTELKILNLGPDALEVVSMWSGDMEETDSSAFEIFNTPPVTPKEKTPETVVKHAVQPSKAVPVPTDSDDTEGLISSITDELEDDDYADIEDDETLSPIPKSTVSSTASSIFKDDSVVFEGEDLDSDTSEPKQYSVVCPVCNESFDYTKE